MRSRPAALRALVLVSVLAVAACSAGDGPGWTYAPAPPATPTPEATASGEPSVAPTGAASGGAGTTLDLVASGVAYDKLELRVPAGEPFAIHLVNRDPAGVPHDVDIEESDGTVLQNTDTIDGGQEVTYTYEPLEAGEYVFQCSIHPIPAMTGKLIVE